MTLLEFDVAALHNCQSSAEPTAIRRQPRRTAGQQLHRNKLECFTPDKRRLVLMSPEVF